MVRRRSSAKALQSLDWCRTHDALDFLGVALQLNYYSQTVSTPIPEHSDSRSSSQCYIASMLHHLGAYVQMYIDLWISTMGQSTNRQRLALDLCLCLVTQAMVMHLLLLQLDRLSGTVFLPPAAVRDSCPSRTVSSLIRIARMAFETQLITRGPGGLTCPGASLPAELPAELVLLAIYVSAWLITIAVVAAPAWFLRSRAYLLMLTSAGCSLVLMSSLITHPNSEPSQHWIHFLTTAGLGLMWNQLMHRVSVLFSLEGGGIDVTDDSPYGLPGCTQSARSMSFYLFP